MNSIFNQQSIILFSIVAFLIIIALYFIYRFFFKKKHVVLYKPRTFLTNNEKDCFKYLKKIFPEYHICPQVSMGALLEPNVSKGNGSEYTILRNKIQSKVVDFVFMNSDFEVVFIVELDDKSHDSKVEQDRIRDLNLLHAGIPTARFRRQGNKFPSKSAIESQIQRN